MPYTKKQVVTCISILYLIIATALAGYAYSRSTARSVPISDTLKTLTGALPILAGLLVETGHDLTRRQERRQHLGRGEIKRPPIVIVTNAIIFIYSTAVITLLGTHAGPPSGLNCALQERWQKLWKNRNSNAIKTIQDAFNCCGFRSPKDMAWPFPSKSNPVDACEKAFGRTSGCLAAWKAEEQQIAGMLIGVVSMVVIWQFLIITIPTQRESWLHRIVPDRVSRILADGENGSAEPRRAIEYNRYSDRVEEEEDEDEGRGAGRAIEEGTRRIHNIIPPHTDQDQQPTVENAWASN